MRTTIRPAYAHSAGATGTNTRCVDQSPALNSRMNDIHSRQWRGNQRVYVTPRLIASAGTAMPYRITRSAPWSPGITMSARNTNTTHSTMPRTCASLMYGRLTVKYTAWKSLSSAGSMKRNEIGRISTDCSKKRWSGRGTNHARGRSGRRRDGSIGAGIVYVAS
jgi:hypothetical protein